MEEIARLGNRIYPALRHCPQREAITAVLESGHALVYMLLRGKLPLKVSLRSSDFSVGGFVRGENEYGWQMLMDDTYGE